jgi:hypothetical protein
MLHLARLLTKLVEDLPPEKIDRYLIRDAQRVIEAVKTLVRMHTAQEEDSYDAVVAGWRCKSAACGNGSGCGAPPPGNRCRPP